MKKWLAIIGIVLAVFIAFVLISHFLNLVLTPSQSAASVIKDPSLIDKQLKENGRVRIIVFMNETNYRPRDTLIFSLSLSFFDFKLIRKDSNSFTAEVTRSGLNIILRNKNVESVFYSSKITTQ